MFILPLEMNGCTDRAKEGKVAIKINDHEAQVYIENGDLIKGEKLILFKQSCHPKLGCSKHKIGEGEITQVINRNYALIQVSQGTPFDEETVVEVAQ